MGGLRGNVVKEEETPRNNMTTRNSLKLRSKAAPSPQTPNKEDQDEEEVDDHERASDFSESSSCEGNNKENEEANDDSADSNHLRRSTRARKSRYGSFNQQWIFGGDGPTAPGYPHDNSPSGSTEDREQQNGTRRSGRLNHMKTQPTAHFEDSLDDDMYSRVKRHNLRRNTQRVNYYENLRQEPVASCTEPVAKRLRDRTKAAKKQKSYSEEYLRPNRFKRRYRRRAVSSSSSSSDDECYTPKKRPNANVIGMDNSSYKAQQHQFLTDLQPAKVDPSVTFESIGGLTDHINKLKEITLFPLLYKEFYNQRNITPPRGILFHGLPGTGKTLMARALANECLHVGGKKVSFFIRKGADILNRWVGESERQLKVLFEQAVAHQPSIIFFDEIDGLAPIRSSKSDQVHNSVVSTLLAELDGVNDRGDIIVIGATNRIDSIDPALRRPGRFDFEIPFFLPGKEARKEILSVHLRKNGEVKQEDILLDELAEKTSGFSGADLKLLCSEAQVSSLRRNFPQIYSSKQKLLVDFSRVHVTNADWAAALKSVRPIQRQIQKPLPPQLLPLLGRNINAIENKINKIFPLKSDVVSEPSLKRMLIHSQNPDVIEEFIMPGILHRFESVKIFRIGLHEIATLGEEQHSAISTLTAAPINYKDPSILYIPRLDSMLKVLSDISRDMLLSRLIASVSSPCLVIATSEDPFIEEFDAFFLEKEEVDKPSDGERRSFFRGVFNQALIVKDDVVAPIEELPLAPIEKSIVNEVDLKKIEKKENATFRELRIFLREILAKLARDRSFVEFTKPVDCNAVPDYKTIISSPMDLETMMTKIDAGEYMSAEMFLCDINLIVQNALAYNPETNDADKRLRHHAKQLRDRAEDLIHKEMDSDFEEVCKEIIKTREERTAAFAEDENRVPLVHPKEEDVSSLTFSSQKKRKKHAYYRGGRKPTKSKKLDMSATPTTPPRQTPSPRPKSTSTSPSSGDSFRARDCSSNMQNLLEKVTIVSKRMTVFDMLEVRYKLCVAVEYHQKNFDKLPLVHELQSIINGIP